MKFSFDNISGDKSICCPNETGARLKDICLSVCVRVKRMMNYICVEIFQVERVNIIETEKE